MSKEKKKESIKSVNEENPIFNYTLFFAFSILICLFTTYKISIDGDVFWHLATGRFIVQNHFIPTTEVFGFLTLGQNWIPFEWGWEVLNYLIFSLGGYVALSVLRTIIVLAVFAILFSLLRKFKVNPYISIFFAFVLILGILTRLTIRPQLVTYLFIVSLIYIFVNHKLENTFKKSILFILPLIFMLWANMHMGVIFGMILFGIFILSEVIDYFFINKNKNDLDKKRKLKFLLISFVLSIVALLINPFFTHVYLYTLSYTKINMLEQINEWKSPLREETLSYYNGKIYFFFLVSGLMLIYYSIKKRDVLPFLLYLFVGIYSMQAVRFMADFMLTIFVFWMIALDSIFKKFKLDKYLNNVVFKVALIIFLVFVIINSYNGNFYKEYLGNYFRETGFGVNEKFFPKSMFDFIKAEEIDKIGKRPFNNLKLGAYFIWEFPESKNFIDSRDLYDDLYTNYKNIDFKKPGFESLIEKYDFDYFMYSTPYLTVNAKEIQNNIVSYLTTANEKWKLVYWDDISFLFVKNVTKFENIIKKYEYKYISPYSYIFERDLVNKKFTSEKDLFNAELKRKLSNEPEGKIIKDMAEYYKRMN